MIKKIPKNCFHEKEKHSLGYFFTATCVNDLKIKGVCELLALYGQLKCLECNDTMYKLINSDICRLKINLSYPIIQQNATESSLRENIVFISLIFLN